MKPGIDSPTHIIVIAALAGWTAIMVQRGIAVFHDGLRHKMGDFVAGRANRDDLVQTGNSLNQLLLLWFVPFSLAMGAILTHVLLLPLDLLGIRSQKWWYAGMIGAGCGAVMAAAVMIGHDILSAMSIDVTAALVRSFQPMLFGMAIIPAVAAAYQFGTIPGFISLVVVLAGYLVEEQLDTNEANALPMLAGLVTLGLFTYRAERQRRQEEDEPLDMGFLETSEDRVKEYSLWFVVQGALMAAAVNMGVFAWFAHDMVAYSGGFQLQAAFAVIMISTGFMPTVVTSVVMTGVSQIVGLTLVFLVAYLAPSPTIAAAAGALVMLAETRLLAMINHLLNQTPTIREVGDSMRGAFDQMSGILLMGGAFMAGETVLPGGGGYLIVGGIIGFNEMAGTPIMRMAIGPVSVLILGLVANLLQFVGAI